MRGPGGTGFLLLLVYASWRSRPVDTDAWLPPVPVAERLEVRQEGKQVNKPVTIYMISFPARCSPQRPIPLPASLQLHQNGYASNNPLQVLPKLCLLPVLLSEDKSTHLKRANSLCVLRRCRRRDGTRHGIGLQRSGRSLIDPQSQEEVWSQLSQKCPHPPIGGHCGGARVAQIYRLMPGPTMVLSLPRCCYGAGSR